MPQGIYTRTPEHNRNNSLAKMGHIPWNKGISWSNPKRRKNKVQIECLSCGNKKEVYPSWGTKKYCSRTCLGKSKLGKPSPRKGMIATPASRLKMRLSSLGRIPGNKGKKMPQISGEKHWNWQGGKTPETKKFHNSLEWKLWRSSVFARDNFTCIDCGAHGVYIEPHHIIPIKQTRSRAFDTSNGITLCRPCHMKTMGKELQLARTYFSLIPAQV